jgi:threonine synthase
MIISTAHPVKFPEVVEQQTGQPVVYPQIASDLLGKPSLKTKMKVSDKLVREFLLEI